MNQNETFQFGSDLKLRWRDRDRFDKVNNVYYLNFLESIRHEYLSKVLDWDWVNFGFRVENVSIQYLSQLVFEDKPRIHVGCTKVTEDNITLSYQIITNRDGKDIITTTAETMLSAYDPKADAAIKINEEVIGLLTDYEGPSIYQVGQAS